MPTAPGARTEARHVFLKMRQPVDESTLPQPRVLESDRTHRLPCTFVMPAQLLPHVCEHGCDSEQVREAHLRLPPHPRRPVRVWRRRGRARRSRARHEQDRVLGPGQAHSFARA